MLQNGLPDEHRVTERPRPERTGSVPRPRRMCAVRRLQIAMDDALLVRRLERLGDLPRNWERIINREWPFRDAVGESLAFDQLHHQRV